MLSISMIVKSDPVNLRRALVSVKDIADEICVVDTGSPPETFDVYKEFDCFVCKMEWPDSFAKARNAALSLCEGDWIMYLDADEEVPRETAAIIAKIVKNEPKNACLSVVRQLDGHEHWAGIRLFPKEGAYWKFRVHEQVAYKEGYTHQMMNARLLILHHGIATAGTDKSAYYLTLARKDFEENPESFHCMKQYALSLLSSGENTAEALYLLYNVKAHIPHEEKNVGVARPIYEGILTALKDQAREVIEEAHRHGYGGWWSAVEWAQLMFCINRPADCLEVCEKVQHLPWDSLGNESYLRERIAVLAGWAEEALKEQDGNRDFDSERELDARCLVG